MRLPASPTFFGTPPTSPQPGFVTPAAAPQPTTPPPVRQQEAMTPPNTPANQGSPTGINEINALASQLTISPTKHTELLKSPSAAEAHSESPATLMMRQEETYSISAFDNLDDDEATTTDNVKITQPQRQHRYQYNSRALKYNTTRPCHHQRQGHHLLTIII